MKYGSILSGNQHFRYDPGGRETLECTECAPQQARAGENQKQPDRLDDIFGRQCLVKAATDHQPDKDAWKKPHRKQQKALLNVESRGNEDSQPRQASQGNHRTQGGPQHRFLREAARQVNREHRSARTERRGKHTAYRPQWHRPAGGDTVGSSREEQAPGRIYDEKGTEGKKQPPVRRLDKDRRAERHAKKHEGNNAAQFFPVDSALIAEPNYETRSEVEDHHHRYREAQCEEMREQRDGDEGGAKAGQAIDDVGQVTMNPDQTIVSTGRSTRASRSTNALRRAG